jgi:beta-1,4-mannooligosaccharide/beta-1,4-mannosyl-N-acetylglucosamine phosphorylase
MAKRRTIIGEDLPNIPWQDKPSGSGDLVWRSTDNPVIGPRAIPKAQGIYNSAVVSFRGRFAGVFRVEYRNRSSYMHVGFSDDGVKWKINHERIKFKTSSPEMARFEGGYDPRVTKLDDWYYMNWCNGYHGATIGTARTKDFRTFEQLENAFLPYNRNGVLFPKKFNGNFGMLSRPSDAGHTPFGDIFYSESPDLEFWGRHRFVMGRGAGGWWEGTKIGAGPVPIETTAGWLMFYHGVCGTCNGFVYQMGAAILDRDEPWKVIARCRDFIMAPDALYEKAGFVPNVFFPVAALSDAATGRIAIYYGAADTYTCLCYCLVDEVIAHIKKNDIIGAG